MISLRIFTSKPSFLASGELDQRILGCEMDLGDQAIVAPDVRLVRRSKLAATPLFSIRLDFVLKERIGIAQISARQFLTTRSLHVWRMVGSSKVMRVPR
jgi:hypothetical protein